MHGSDAEYALRLGIFRANVDFISRHNAQNSKSHTLAVNRFVDWSEVRFCNCWAPFMSCPRDPLLGSMPLV